MCGFHVFFLIFAFRIYWKKGYHINKNANDEGYEAHTYQAWALVVFSKRSRLRKMVSLRGACCYMKVLAPFSKTIIINLLKINNINMNHFNETSSRPPPEGR